MCPRSGIGRGSEWVASESFGFGSFGWVYTLPLIRCLRKGRLVSFQKGFLGIHLGFQNDGCFLVLFLRFYLFCS